ncbi:predicted protein [Nematostella vectensis]|uniref:Cation efflux protein transmembrane domain-containing protein n=1 Tax=Nematostella vectensis TaxID=45351 RepID=A7SW64_NEMVE|nr:transmembrane protein 163 [Nematostella vectensis]EDO32046.1 predicted protein [Nematostella vectensis]|eukprot:XP_001624146.1 predicted protein [Nematostella vectensis]
MMTCIPGYELLRASLDTNEDDSDDELCLFSKRLEVSAFKHPLDGEENGSQFMDEDVICFTIEEKVFIPVNFRQRWSRAAFSVAIIAIVVTLSISIWSFVASGQTSSSAIFSCGFDALLEAFSTLIVIWRFKDLRSEDGGAEKERLATLLIAFTFLITGTATLSASTVHFFFKDHPNQTERLLSILLFSGISHLLLASIFYYIAKKLHSSTLKAEVMNNVLSVAMSVGILASTMIYRAHKPSMWWLDHSVAIVIGLTALLYGVKLIVLDVEQCGEVVCGGGIKGEPLYEEELEPLTFFKEI